VTNRIIGSGELRASGATIEQPKLAEQLGTAAEHLFAGLEYLVDAADMGGVWTYQLVPGFAVEAQVESFLSYHGVEETKLIGIGHDLVELWQLSHQQRVKSSTWADATLSSPTSNNGLKNVLP